MAALLAVMEIDDTFEAALKAGDRAGTDLGILEAKVLVLLLQSRPLRARQIAQLLGADPGQVSRCLFRLEGEGMIKEGGKRPRSLTPLGTDLAAEVRSAQEQLSREILGRVGSLDRQAILELTRRISESDAPRMNPTIGWPDTPRSIKGSKEQTDAQVPDFVLLATGAAAAKRFLTTRFARPGLHLNDIRILVNLRDHPHQIEVSTRLGKQISLISRAVRHLARAGLIVHRGIGERLLVTDKGSELIVAIGASCSAFLDHVSSREHAAIRMAVTRAREARQAVANAPDNTPVRERALDNIKIKQGELWQVIRSVGLQTHAF